MLSRLPLVLACLLTAAPAWAAAPETAARGSVSAEIAPATTSIYVGSVTLSVDTLVRHAGVYVSNYTARVFPFFFCNESGQLRMDVTDAELRRLASGMPGDFTGYAVRGDGLTRPVQGHAVPRGPADGQVKVRVVVSRNLTLIFNTTYHLTGRLD